MSISVWLWLHIQTAICLGWLSCLLPRVKHRRRLMTICLLSWMPLEGLDVSAQLLPYSGVLSLTSGLLLLDYIAKRLQCCAGLINTDRQLLIYGAVILGAILYPVTLWPVLPGYDLYNWGYTGMTFPLLVAGFALAAWKSGQRPLAMLLLVSLWSWALNLAESQNLWDYILDPWLVLYAICKVLVQLALFTSTLLHTN